MILLRTFIILTATICIGVAGPFPPAAGQSGSTAIARTDVTIQAWASRVTSYQPGTGLTAEWSQPERALGPATGQVEHVASLGDGGSITLTFDGVIIDGPGPDFVIFENGFDDYFIECAFVEVSADGVNFVRFPGQSHPHRRPGLRRDRSDQRRWPGQQIPVRLW